MLMMLTCLAACYLLPCHFIDIPRRDVFAHTALLPAALRIVWYRRIYLPDDPTAMVMRDENV